MSLSAPTADNSATMQTATTNGTLSTITATYDAMNHLITKTWTPVQAQTTPAGSSTASFADNNPLLDYAGSGGAVQQWYTLGSGPNDLLNQVNAAAGMRATLIPDIQGSIVGSLDSSTGALTKAGYQTYGQSTTTVNSNFGYTRSRLAVAGLYDMRARFYSPIIGRFLSTDPIGHRGGVNLYAYVKNDPLNLRDPMGMSPESLITGRSRGRL